MSIQMSTTAARTAEDKYAALQDRLRELAPVVVALSGGVDSSFLLAAAVEVVGDRAVAAVGVSPSLAGDDLREARTFAVSLGVELREVVTHELDDPNYVLNAGDRCFFCKMELYQRILDSTGDVAGRTVVDGTNASDEVDDRPGMVAGRDLGVVSPLRDVGLEKPEIRWLSRERELPTWDKPEAACLASRLPVGVPVTAGALGRIERAERALKRLGLIQVRVRHQDGTARIETALDEMAIVLANRDAIVAELRGLGYDYITLDLAGYTRGGRAPRHGEDSSKGG
jgi:uncharacterized protein